VGTVVLRARPELGASLAAETGVQRATRFGSAALGALIGLALVVQGHLAHWERGVSAWFPAFRGTNGLLEHLRATVWTLVPSTFASDASVTPRIDVVKSAATSSVGEAGVGYGLAIAAVGMAVLLFAILSAVRPAAEGSVRKTAWLVASDLAGRLVLALGVLWLVGAIAIARQATHLASINRTVHVAASVEEVEARIRRVLDERSLDVRQNAIVGDARSGAHYTDIVVLRSQGVSPFDTWWMSWSGPVRRSTQMWISATHIDGSNETEVRFSAGFYDPNSMQASRAVDALERLAKSISTGTR